MPAQAGIPHTLRLPRDRPFSEGWLFLRGGSYPNLFRSENDFKLVGHSGKVTRGNEESFAGDCYAAFLFHDRTEQGLAMVMTFTERKAPGATISGVESSSKSRLVTLCVDQNLSSSSQEVNLGSAFNFFPISSSFFRFHVHGGDEKILSSSLKLQYDFQKPRTLRDSEYDKPNRIFLMPQSYTSPVA
jgi:hypothetical protein